MRWQLNTQSEDGKLTTYRFCILFGTGKRSLLLAPLQDRTFKFVVCLQHVSYRLLVSPVVDDRFCRTFASDSNRLVQCQTSPLIRTDSLKRNPEMTTFNALLDPDYMEKIGKGDLFFSGLKPPELGYIIVP